MECRPPSVKPDWSPTCETRHLQFFKKTMKRIFLIYCERYSNHRAASLVHLIIQSQFASYAGCAQSLVKFSHLDRLFLLPSKFSVTHTIRYLFSMLNVYLSLKVIDIFYRIKFQPITKRYILFILL